MTWLAIQFIIGVLLLVKGADWFAKAAAQIAELTGLPRLVLGAILIGLATNVPEFAVSLSASWAGHGGIAFGNAVGSNVVNTGLILGIILLQTGVSVELTWLRDHGIPMILACTLTYALSLFGDISYHAGILLLLICLSYLAWSVISAKRNRAFAQEAQDFADATLGDQSVSIRYRWLVVSVLLLISVFLVVFSSRWVLSTVVQLERALGISETVIALTLVAVGTSLPELATALSALRRGHHDTSLGIILGSNIYNILGVIGGSALLGRIPVTTANRLFDVPIMLLLVIIPLIPCMWGKAPGRRVGYALIAIYCIYTYSLFTVHRIF